MSAEPARLGSDSRSPYWTFTPTGACFDFDNPRPEMIHARALAWSLSGEGRWANNTHWPMSVAQHSLLVAHAIRQPAWRIYGLLHDAAEAFTRDLPTPFKHWLVMRGADVMALERRILCEAVYPHFELPTPTAEIAAAVDEADARALATEYRDAVMGKGPEWIPSGTPLPGPTIRFQRRDVVEQQWLNALETMLRDARIAGIAPMRV